MKKSKLMIIVLALSVIAAGFTGCANKSNMKSSDLLNGDKKVVSTDLNDTSSNKDLEAPPNASTDSTSYSDKNSDKGGTTNTANTSSSNKSNTSQSSNTTSSTSSKSSNVQTAPKTTTQTSTSNKTTSSNTTSSTKQQSAPAPVRASGIDQALTDKFNDKLNTVNGYSSQMPNDVASGKVDQLKQACISIALNNVVPDNIKTVWYPITGNTFYQFKYRSHTLNVVTNENDVYYTRFIANPSLNSGFRYVIAYWDSSISHYKFYYVEITLA